MARELRLPDQISGFVLPLGASVFRVGGAIGQSVGVVFLAHLYGVPLGPVQLATIVLAAVVTSFSVPGVPGGSIIVMVPVAAAVGVPAAGVGLLLGIDSVPDMFRTTANATGNMAAAVVLGRTRTPAQPHVYEEIR
jgi:Na+/H+-dicarboxylate symporter